VSSTETAWIFGNIVYESTSVLDRSVVVLNDIHIDIMDYISPGTCVDVASRNMWAEFEWENEADRLAAPPPGLLLRCSTGGHTQCTRESEHRTV